MRTRTSHGGVSDPMAETSGEKSHTSIAQFVSRCRIVPSVPLTGYRSRWWGTFRQIQQLGGHVRKGEKATHIILFRPITKTSTADDGSEVEERIPIMRTFCVFNAEQTAGLEYLWPGRTELAPAVVEERYQHADAVIAATGADIRHGGNQAFFSRNGDYIQMPFRHQFPSVPHYYESLCHEMIHWTETPAPVELGTGQRGVCGR